MKHVLSLGFFLATLFLLIPPDLASVDAQGAAEPKIVQAGGKEWQMLGLVALGQKKEMDGTIEAFDLAGNKMTLRVKYKAKIDDPDQPPDPALTARRDELEKQYKRLLDDSHRLQTEAAQAQKGKDRKSAGTRTAQLQGEQQKLREEAVKVKHEYDQVNADLDKKKKVIDELIDFQMTMKDPVRLRQHYLTKKVDDKGKTIEYTVEEKAKLRGKVPSIPGYEALPAAFTQGRKVIVTLELPKGSIEHYKAAPEKIVAPANPPAASTDSQSTAPPAKDPSTVTTYKDIPPQFRPVVKMIVIQNDEDGPPKTGKKK